ncbi:zinc-binding dehydrogenase [Roseomonas eburnea]|uniref:Zinc-binding dehydrogenase n=1 Tax=Neoroseomonas eburnea TaxID=1346889 RepID=A0A9X9XED4_9PROT|nr:zinc-binding dehydrogenase [Neoroseomonas eburnea]MBR0682070.1 zinc-binding dehydrogenase [Neoroseomonas eburnea]
MKAALLTEYAGPSAIVLRDLPEPVPAEGEVLLGFEAAEVNYPDALVVSDRYQTRPPLPFIPGKAMVGRVLDARGAAAPARGARVIAHVEYGAFAERVALPAAACLPVPEGIDAADAAALGLNYQTAHFALAARGGLAAGESVLVLDASGAVGAAALQLARPLGAAQVLAGIRGEAAATGGRGVDVVIDPLGDAVTAAALRCLAPCGRLVVVGFAAGEIPQIRSNYLLVKSVGVLGLNWADRRDREPARVAAVQAEIFALFLEGRLRSRIHRRLPLAAAAEALDLVARGGLPGRVLLEG